MSNHIIVDLTIHSIRVSRTKLGFPTAPDLETATLQPPVDHWWTTGGPLGV